MYFRNALLLFFCLAIHCTYSQETIPADSNGLRFYPGAYKLNDSAARNAFIYFDRPYQRLYVRENDAIIMYTASDIASFRYSTNPEFPEESSILIVSWRFNRDWPSYEVMTFFEVIQEFRNCALVTSDRRPVVVDQYPDSLHVFKARQVQGKNYHLILADGSVVPYERNSIDENLHIILDDRYDEVMRYAYEHGLRPTRLYDLIAMLRFASQL